MRNLDTFRSTTRFGAVLFFIASLLNGCGGSYGGMGTPSSAILTGITITPSSATIINGTTARLTATGSYSNGTSSDVSSLINWTSAAPAIASAVSPGVVTAAAVGTTSVTASFNNGIGYGTISTSDVITVTAASLTGITISPLTMSLARGSATTLTATGTFSDSSNGNISGSVTWTSSAPAVATVNASGIATAVNAGTSTITASMGTVSNTATVTVP